MSQTFDTFLKLIEEESSEGKLSKKDADLDSEAKAYLKKQQAEIKEIEDRNKHRYKYANQFMRISSLSLIFVGSMVIADGSLSIGFDLSDPVIIALLGTALSTVLAPTYLLAKYIFKHDGDGASK